MSYITCRELISFLDDYLAGEVAGPRLELFERHLSRCASCREYLKSYRETIRLARAATTHPAVEEVPPELLTAILDTVARNTNH